MSRGSCGHDDRAIAMPLRVVHDRVVTPRRRALFAIAYAIFASACEPPANEGEGAPDDDIIVDGDCDADADCAPGELCLASACVFAACDPSVEDACDAGELVGSHCCGIVERCSPDSFACEPDIDVGPCDAADITCVQCTSQEQCSAGQICSSGLCLDAAGRQQCTATFQCADGEHCDRQVFLCVPLRPCATCSPQTPHLCCFDDEVCLDDDAGGVCVIPQPPECAAADDCPAGLFCNATQQCVQCDDTGDCGPGLTCDVEEGLCISNTTCVTDAECDPGERCASQTRECVVPECESTDDCDPSDPRLFCDLGRFVCALGDPVCMNDVDEENDSVESATPIELGVPFAGTLCREDVDMLVFPVDVSLRYTATVEMPGGGGSIATMLNGTFAVESTVTFPLNADSVAVTGVTGADESGSMFVALQGNSGGADQLDYIVTVVASAAE